LGDVKLEIEEVKIHGVGSFEASVSGESKAESAKVHERSKKVVGHHFKLGEVVTGPPGSFCKTTTLRRVCTFVFKYRPLELLRANGIAPLDKGQKRVAEDPEEDDVGDDVQASDILRIKELESELEALKRKTGQSSKKLKTEVKTEADISLGRRQLGDIIDLT